LWTRSISAASDDDVAGDALDGCGLAAPAFVGRELGVAVGLVDGDALSVAVALALPDVGTLGVAQKPAIPSPMASASTSANGRKLSAAADLGTTSE